MKYILIIVAVSLMISCNTQKKAQRKAHAYFSMNPDELAKLCGSRYIERIKYIKGDTIITTETVTDTVTDTVKIDCPDGSKVNRDCPPCKNKIVTKTIIDTLEISSPELVAKTIDLSNDLQLYKERLDKETLRADKSEKRAKNRLFWAIGLAVALALFIAYIIYLFIKNLKNNVTNAK